MIAESLLAWWNLIYSVPFLLAVTYLAVYAISGLTFGDADVDHDADADVHPALDAEPDADLDHDLDLDADADLEADLDADVDVDADADLDVDADADFDGDADADLDADADQDLDAVAGQPTSGAAPVSLAHGGHAGHAALARGDAVTSLELPLYLQALLWLGLGRVPFSIVLMVMFLSWGMIGFVTNYLLSPLMPRAELVLLASLPAAVAGSAAITRGVVIFIGRWLPTSETYALPIARLVGISGEAVYNIDNTFGLAAVRDRQGDLFQVPCRVYSHRHPINKGQRVLLVDYDRDQRFFYVTEYELDR
jgi:hypothetical protein